MSCVDLDFFKWFSDYIKYPDGQNTCVCVINTGIFILYQNDDRKWMTLTAVFILLIKLCESVDACDILAL
jgi:hypothetical protein